MMNAEITCKNVQSYSGTSAPWTGQIIVTEEEPAGKPNFNNLTLKKKKEEEEAPTSTNINLRVVVLIFFYF